MAWRWSKREVPASPRSTSTTSARPDPDSSLEVEPAPPSPRTHPSPGLAGLLDHLRTVSRPQILDLGPPVAANIPFFAEFRGRHHVVDLHASLQDEEERAVRFHQQPQDVLEELLPAVDGGFHAVLTWDLFNYLTREPWAALGDVLARRTAPGALLLALLATGHEIPSQPHRFAVEAHDQLTYRTTVARPRKCPRWPPAEVGKQMSGFRVERSYLLRHGVQEYLLARR